MKLYFSPASPFVAKVRMAARFADIALEEVQIDVMANEVEFLAANPLGKIPCLVLDDGRGVHDSRVIMHHLDRLSDGKLYPADDNALLAVESLESLADGISDAGVAGIYEIRMRPEEKWHQPWIDRQWGKVQRALDYLEASSDMLAQPMSAGTLALIAALGYLDLRYADRWQDGHPLLVAWQQKMAAEWPQLVELIPAA